MLGQAAPDQRPDLSRQLTEASRVINQPVDQCRVRSGPERTLAAPRESEDRAQAEHVTRRSDVMAENLLRGHEPGRADHHVRTGLRTGLSRPGNPEVDDPRAILGQQDIRGLQVPVHDVRGMDGAQALGQTRRQGQQRPRIQRSVLLHRLEQRRPGDIGRGQPRHRAVQIGVDHEGGEEPAHLAGRGDLLPEPGPELRIVGEFLADDLDGDRAAACRHAEEHVSHAAGAQPP
jgi:hypothetical protein